MNKSKVKTIVLWVTAVLVGAFILFGGGYAAIKGGLSDFLAPITTDAPAS